MTSSASRHEPTGSEPGRPASAFRRRLAALGIPETEETRRAYPESIVTPPVVGDCISGAILHDETIGQNAKYGTPVIEILAKADIIPGIKVDTVAEDTAPHPREKITEGLEGLRERPQPYVEMSARF